MTPVLSLYLDVLRFGAALMVFLSHAATQRVSSGLLYQFQPLGQFAVDVFFVLSGLVIAHTVATRDTDARRYVVNRAARIYSVAVPALVLGVLLDAVGRVADPVLYANMDWFHWQGWPSAVAGSLLMLNEVWFNAIAPGTNLPYWSLGFEAWYYVIFGLFCFSPPRWRWGIAAVALVVAGPKIAILFPLWLLGVATWHLCRSVTIGPRLAWVLVLAPLLVLPVLESGAAGRTHWPFAVISGDFGLLVDSRWDFILGLALMVHLLGVRWVRLPAVSPLLAAAVRRVAGGTFTLYLLHFPLIHCIIALSPWPHDAWQTRGAVFLGAPLLLLALAQGIEARRDWWRRSFDALLPRWRATG